MIEPNDPFERKMSYDAHYDGNLNRCHRLVRQDAAGNSRAMAVTSRRSQFLLNTAGAGDIARQTLLERKRHALRT
jgi:hypothetical protein